MELQSNMPNKLLPKAQGHSAWGPMVLTTIRGKMNVGKGSGREQRKQALPPLHKHSAHHSLEVWLSNTKQDWQVGREGGCGQSDQESQLPWNRPSLSTKSPTSQGSSQSWARPVSWSPWRGDTQQDQVRTSRQVCIPLKEELELGLTVCRNALGASMYNVPIQGVHQEH